MKNVRASERSGMEETAAGAIHCFGTHSTSTATIAVGATE